MTDYYYEHQQLVKRFKLLAVKEIPNIRIFDRHVGKFILIRFIKALISGKCKLSDWKKHLIAVNKPGMADAYALLKTKYGLIEFEIEFKGGKSGQSKEQKDWERIITNMGGFYLLIRDENQGVLDIKNHIIKSGIKCIM